MGPPILRPAREDGYGHDALPAAMDGRSAPAHSGLRKLLRSFRQRLTNSSPLHALGKLELVRGDELLTFPQPRRR